MAKCQILGSASISLLIIQFTIILFVVTLSGHRVYDDTTSSINSGNQYYPSHAIIMCQHQ